MTVVKTWNTNVSLLYRKSNTIGLLTTLFTGTMCLLRYVTSAEPKSSRNANFPEGSVLEQRIRAPTAVYVEGRRHSGAAWQGTTVFEGKVARRFAMALLADLPDEIGEGVVNRLVLYRW